MGSRGLRKPAPKRFFGDPAEMRVAKFSPVVSTSGRSTGFDADEKIRFVEYADIDKFGSFAILTSLSIAGLRLRDLAGKRNTDDGSSKSSYHQTHFLHTHAMCRDAKQLIGER